MPFLDFFASIFLPHFGQLPWVSVTIFLVNLHSGNPLHPRNFPNGPILITIGFPHSSQITSVGSSGTFTRLPSISASAFSSVFAKLP